ncbi:MAG: carbamoyltransferase HypF [Euryarchaeota archaeon]|nr:carbamoyltransferase HypF [Euryarchaeota archaeon]
MEFTRIVFYGVVQGVGFRPTAYRVANALGLRGYVRNNGSNVEVVVDRMAPEYVEAFRKALPPLARIEDVGFEEVAEETVRKALGHAREVAGFSIVHSKSGSRDSPIPADTAMCEPCRRELLDSKDRRHLFPFTNCTDCGARFSVIRDVPYDRRNTSMDEFRLCPECLEEYRDPEDRRFHAQTISCPRDGPRYTLYDSGRKAVAKETAVQEAARRLDAGQMGVVKGWGGMHIVCRLEECGRLREWYRRPAKPFAVMFRDLDTVRRFARVDEQAERLITSIQRPIVLLPRKARCPELLSPGLGNVGCYLPYSGLHYILFVRMRADALIMTSANPAGEPMLLENEEAFSLGLDFCLLHDRNIINRCDDSVVIPFRGRRFFIRKSRGWVPDGIAVPYRERILAMGAERNVNSAISKDGKLYASQYIGNTTRYNVGLFQDHATRYLMRLLGIPKVEKVVVDLHPQYSTRRLGTQMAQEFGARVVEVQHHWAHAASLMLDNGLGAGERIMCLSVDGAGFGTDGTVWGGEVLLAGYGGFERAGTLEDFPLIGGDAAVKDPPRLVLALLEQAGVDWREWELHGLIGDEKAALLEKMAPTAVRTSSLGRVLDALACYLGVGTGRTYDGEPAMRLERHIAIGEPLCQFVHGEPRHEGKRGARVVEVAPLFRRLHEHARKAGSNEKAKADLARSFVECLVRQMVDIAADRAEAEGIRRIGLTGGVSYNLPFCEIAIRRIEERGLEPLLHDRIPSGDGGISAGQNVIAGSAR